MRISDWSSDVCSSDLDEDAVVEIERLAVEVARGFADLEKLLDLGMRDVEVAGGRAAAEAALRDREGERVHHADEGDDAAGLAVEADGFADAAHRAPIGADAAAPAGEPDILVLRSADALQAVVDSVSHAAYRYDEAVDRKTHVKGTSGGVGR